MAVILPHKYGIYAVPLQRAWVLPGLFENVPFRETGVAYTVSIAYSVVV